jgi:hypothetical protein
LANLKLWQFGNVDILKKSWRDGGRPSTNLIFGYKLRLRTLTD